MPHTEQTNQKPLMAMMGWLLRSFLAFPLLSFALPLALSGAVPEAQANFGGAGLPEAAGSIASVTGDASLSRNGVTLGTLKEGQKVQVGDSLVASPEGGMVIALKDNSLFVMGASSRLRIDSFFRETATNRRFFNVTFEKGAFRIVRGAEDREGGAVPDSGVCLLRNNRGQIKNIQSQEIPLQIDSQTGVIEMQCRRGTPPTEVELRSQSAVPKAAARSAPGPAVTVNGTAPVIPSGPAPGQALSTPPNMAARPSSGPSSSPPSGAASAVIPLEEGPRAAGQEVTLSSKQSTATNRALLGIHQNATRRAPRQASRQVTAAPMAQGMPGGTGQTASMAPSAAPASSLSGELAAINRQIAQAEQTLTGQAQSSPRPRTVSPAQAPAQAPVRSARNAPAPKGSPTWMKDKMASASSRMEALEGRLENIRPGSVPPANSVPMARHFNNLSSSATASSRRRTSESQRASSSPYRTLPAQSSSPSRQSVRVSSRGTGPYTIQVGAYRDVGNAHEMQDKLQALGVTSNLSTSRRGLTVVRFGGYPSLRAAREAATSFKRQSGIDAIPVRY